MKVRLNQLSIGSQLKLVLVSGLGAAILFVPGLLLIDALVGGTVTDDDPIPIAAIAALIIVGAFTLLHLAGMAVMRLLPWRGPEIEVRDTGTVSRIFE
jgi:hypothetical protein